MTWGVCEVTTLALVVVAELPAMNHRRSEPNAAMGRPSLIVLSVPLLSQRGRTAGEPA